MSMYGCSEFFTNFSTQPLHVTLPAIYRAMNARFARGPRLPLLALSDSFEDAVGMTLGGAYAMALWARAFYSPEAPEWNGAFRIMLRDLPHYDAKMIQFGVPRLFSVFDPAESRVAGYGHHPFLPLSAISLRFVLSEPDNPPTEGGWCVVVECANPNCPLYLIAKTQSGVVKVIAAPPYVAMKLGGGEYLDVIVANVGVNVPASSLPSAGLGIRIGLEYRGLWHDNQRVIRIQGE